MICFCKLHAQDSMTILSIQRLNKAKIYIVARTFSYIPFHKCWRTIHCPSHPGAWLGLASHDCRTESPQCLAVPRQWALSSWRHPAPFTMWPLRLYAIKGVSIPLNPPHILKIIKPLFKSLADYIMSAEDNVPIWRSIWECNYICKMPST